MAPLFRRTLQVSPVRRGMDLICIYTDERPDLCRELPNRMFDEGYGAGMTLIWKAPAYHRVMQILHNPLYAAPYPFGRRAPRTRIIDGRARRVSGFDKPRKEWNVLLRDNHRGYISWQDYEDNQKLLLENVHMKNNCGRKSARRGRALLTGLMR
ncbi:recombinase family protein [Bradyrhizobium sp. CW11]|uniref:recombinase family protein n=1 Tax=Bradyrhizobium sp. CW11 TaxID=2782684 RepID=UPI001FFBCA6F|nr:recombinase family protein [Bradyrhizobium sp. CW11]